ncbi:16S rRNA (cytosine(1402)-N(4))-methyltransferase RsmH [bacterium]|nr:MAG: 16S rRNA (cytosine(1402)-N(4))-methyltransferase RsmH [bacterium]
MTQRHIPVLQREVLDALRPANGETYVDLTAGFGGHAQLVLDKLGSNGSAYLIDQDQAALQALYEKFHADRRVHIYRANFAELDWSALSSPDCILADIGVSSVQLDDATRGFSFRHDAPLDMRMDQSRGQTAAELIAEISELDLANLIWRYGEEKKSRQIARAIIMERATRPITTTTQLAELVRAQFPGGYHRIDPATRTFQALRIVVNQELVMLERMLDYALVALAPGGRLAVISFHSLEDRIIKQKMRDITRDLCDTITGQALQESQFRLVTKRPIIPADNEIAYNPRARSAKLRVVEKKK